MTDEVGEHFRISLVVWMTGALVAVVVGVALFSFLVYNQYTSKYTDAMVDSTTGSLLQLTRHSSVTCPTAYASISASIDRVDRVEFVNASGTSEILYDHNNLGLDNLISLMTGVNTVKNVRVEITQSVINGSMICVKLTEVDR